MKLNFKFSITTLVLLLLLFSSVCFATSSTLDKNNHQEPTIIDSDLYITNSNYEINNIVNGNVFIFADKFVLKSESQINGDLYVCANEVNLEQYAKISGNTFICSNTVILNGEINGSLYATTQNFNMQYNGFIDRDLFLHAENATINGYIDRNSFITANNITTNDKFVNQGNFTVADADNLIFSGEILGDATINSKNITLKNKENDNNISCKIVGNLSYSSTKEIEISEGIVLKEIIYNNYTDINSKNVFSNIFDYFLNLIKLLCLVFVLYAIIYKFLSKCLDKLSNINSLNLLKYLGIGLLFLILIPIISILLLASNVGSILGIILLLLYTILLIIAKPIFIIGFSAFAKNKISNKINIYLYILTTSVILSLISLIPYVRFGILILVSLTGFGMITQNLILKNR